MKKKSSQKKILKWILVILWMALIFFLSHQGAEESGALSGGLLEKLFIIIGFIEKILQYEFDREILHMLLRKTAHFTAYMILGILLIHALAEAKDLRKKLYLQALVIAVLYAITDEFHQSFISGRSGEIKDVLIDSSGAFTGIYLFWIFRFFNLHFSQ